MAFRYTQPHHKQPSYCRDTTHNSSEYYQAHISNLKDVSHYPSVYDEAFRNDIGSSHEDEDGIIHIEHHHHHVPEAPARHLRARFVDFVESNDGERKMIKFKEEKGSHGGVIRSVDDAADGFIKAKHRGFGLRQWKTFKM